MARSTRGVRRSLVWLVPLCLSGLAAAAEPGSGGGLATMLATGGYVILMRHASSPAAPPPAGQADVANTHQERQLDAPGRAAAQGMGTAFRRLHIPVGEVLCSPTYRARETARLAGWPQPRIAAQLGDGGHSMQADPTGQRGAWLRKRAAIPPRAGTDTLIVTQLPNIAEAFPQGARGLKDGGALILRPDGQGGVMPVGQIQIQDWGALSASR